MLFYRQTNTDRSGRAFSHLQIQAVWNKGRIVPNEDPEQYRYDACGVLIYRWDYGKFVERGWEIDHIQPIAAGGGDDLSNLQPLQWENNRSKGDSWPYWNCAIGSK